MTDPKRPGSRAPGGRWPDDTEELGLEDVEIIEEAMEVVEEAEPFADEVTPVRRDVGAEARAAARGQEVAARSQEDAAHSQEAAARSREDAARNRQAAAQEFDSALAKALGAETARDIAALKKKRRLEKRRKLPHEQPSAGALENRPVEVSGEVRLFGEGELSLADAVPEDSEGGVQVSAAVGPGDNSEGTARIKRPKGLEGEAPTGRKAKVGILIAVIALGVVGMGVGGVVLWKKRARARRSKKIERKLKLMKLRRKLNRRYAVKMSPGQCVPGMVWIATGKTLPSPGFCVDVYEFPNKKGGRPAAAEDHQKAVILCWEEGKRLCTGAEWRRVCRGKQGNKFPYGAAYHPSKCVTKPPKVEAPPVQKSGSWAGCRSEEGVYDLSGNMAEWVKEGVLVGGSGTLTGDDTACAAEGRGGSPAYYGTRCCLSPLKK